MASIHVDLPALPRKSPYPIGYAKEQNIHSLVIQLTADLLGFDFYVLKLLRGDGLIVESDELTETDGVLTVLLTSKFLYCSGQAEAQVFAYKVVNGELSQIKESAHFKFCIDPSVAEYAREQAQDEPAEKHILDGEVTTEKLADGAVTSEKLDADLEATLEKATNKVTTIDASSTHAQYPSAKAVYDGVSGVAMALGTQIDAREEVANKVNSLSGTLSANAYPSAVAVKNYVELKINEALYVDEDEEIISSEESEAE